MPPTKAPSAMKVSARARRIEPSITMAITAKAKAMREAGKDVLGFGAGEPDFDTPEHIKAACAEALRKGATKYTPAAGTLELRQAVAEKLKRDNGLAYDAATQVVVGMGGKHVLYELFQATLDPGDEVIIPAPYWVSYPEMVRLADGVPVFVSAGADQDFKITPEQLRDAITPRTVAFILNSPSNPTGMVYSPAELRAVAEVALEAGLMIISDEIYEKLLYDGAEHLSIASVSPEFYANTITVNGLSKAYSMTGWRLGYAAGPAPIIKAMSSIQSHATSNPVTFAQAGAVAALRGGYEFLGEFLKAFDERRRILVSALNAIPGVHCPLPKGAFYVFPDFTGVLGRRTPQGRLIETTMQLADYLLDDVGVAIVPGEGFGAPGCARLSYATSTKIVTDGAKRLAEGIARLT